MFLELVSGDFRFDSTASRVFFKNLTQLGLLKLARLLWPHLSRLESWHGPGSDCDPTLTESVLANAASSLRFDLGFLGQFVQWNKNRLREEYKFSIPKVQN